MTRENFIKKWLGNKDYQYTEQNRDLMRDDLDEVINQALRQPHVSGAVALLKFLKEEQQKNYADAKDYMSANQHQYYEEGCEAVLQLIEMRFGN